MKTPYRDGTTHVIFERGGPPSLDFIAKLAALVPKPRVNLTRFHGVFARGGLPPNSRFRVHVTPAKRSRGRKRHQPTGDNWLDKTPAERHASMTGFCSCKTGIHAIHGNNLDAPAEAGIQLGRIRIDIETCERCAGQVKIIVDASNRCIRPQGCGR